MIGQKKHGACIAPYPVSRIGRHQIAFRFFRPPNFTHFLSISTKGEKQADSKKVRAALWLGGPFFD
jgi:hypothetical protein